MKKRKGMTIVEVVIALLLMGLAFIVIGRLTGARIEQSEGLEYHFDMRAADGYMYGIYQDFHNCNDYEIIETNNTVNGVQMLSTKVQFDMGTQGTRIYEFRVERLPSALNPGEYIEHRKCYYNNVEQFDCSAFIANGNEQFLYVSVQLDSGQRLEYQIYR